MVHSIQSGDSTIRWFISYFFIDSMASDTYLSNSFILFIFPHRQCRIGSFDHALFFK